MRRWIARFGERCCVLDDTLAEPQVLGTGLPDSMREAFSRDTFAARVYDLYAACGVQNSVSDPVDSTWLDEEDSRSGGGAG